VSRFNDWLKRESSWLGPALVAAGLLWFAVTSALGLVPSSDKYGLPNSDMGFIPRVLCTWGTISFFLWGLEHWRWRILVWLAIGAAGTTLDCAGEHLFYAPTDYVGRLQYLHFWMSPIGNFLTNLSMIALMSGLLHLLNKYVFSKLPPLPRRPGPA